MVEKQVCLGKKIWVLCNFVLSSNAGIHQNTHTHIYTLNTQNGKHTHSMLNTMQSLFCAHFIMHSLFYRMSKLLIQLFPWGQLIITKIENSYTLLQAITSLYYIKLNAYRLPTSSPLSFSSLFCTYANTLDNINFDVITHYTLFS